MQLLGVNISCLLFVLAIPSYLFNVNLNCLLFILANSTYLLTVNTSCLLSISANPTYLLCCFLFISANPTYLFTWLYNSAFQAVINASVSVDTFFILSGLLAAYVFLKDFEKRQTSLKKFFKGLPKLFLHRYIR